MNAKYKFLIISLLFLITGMGACGNEEPQWEIFENHEISACGVDDPLRNLEWLTEFCKEIKEQKRHVDIYLYKVTEKDECVFEIYYPSNLNKHDYNIDYFNCSNDRIFHWYTGTSPSPWYYDFMKDKEYVDILFYLHIKQ